MKALEGLNGVLDGLHKVSEGLNGVLEGILKGRSQALNGLVWLCGIQ